MNDLSFPYSRYAFSNHTSICARAGQGGRFKIDCLSKTHEFESHRMQTCVCVQKHTNTHQHATAHYSCGNASTQTRADTLVTTHHYSCIHARVGKGVNLRLIVFQRRMSSNLIGCTAPVGTPVRALPKRFYIQRRLAWFSGKE